MPDYDLNGEAIDPPFGKLEYISKENGCCW
jgi:hypothetical protein